MRAQAQRTCRAAERRHAGCPALRTPGPAGDRPGAHRHEQRVHAGGHPDRPGARTRNGSALRATCSSPAAAVPRQPAATADRRRRCPVRPSDRRGETEPLEAVHHQDRARRMTLGVRRRSAAGRGRRAAGSGAGRAGGATAGRSRLGTGRRCARPAPRIRRSARAWPPKPLRPAKRRRAATPGHPLGNDGSPRISTVARTPPRPGRG